MAPLKFAVLGAGVIGSTTALELQSEFRNSQVTIFSEKFNNLTTSDVAAGIFRPGTSFTVISEEVTRKVMRDSYEFYDRIRLNNATEPHGISEISGYIFSTTSQSLVENYLIDKIVPEYRRATEDELQLCPGDWKYGSFFTTLVTECRDFLPWCLQRFQQENGTVVTGRIGDFRDLKSEKFDVIVNCLGLGAKELCKDKKIVPIRGQVLKVSGNWLKNFFYADYDTYVIPGGSSITLGGCRHYDSYDLSVSPYDTMAIWDRCTKLVPRLKNCSIESVRVGLRPHRDPVRVEKETIHTQDGTFRVVHNYGHGGYGVTTAPGTAKQAVMLVKETLIGKSKI